MFYQWIKGTVIIIGELMVSCIKEKLLSNKLQRNNGRRTFKLVKPILKRKPGYIILAYGTNNAKKLNSGEILDKYFS